MKRIPLTQGKFALVDDEDYERASRHKWMTYRRKDGRYFAIHQSNENGRRGKIIYLHRFIYGARAEERVQARNGDALDCRRRNLFVKKKEVIRGKDGIYRVPLTKGFETAVDGDDVERLSMRTWTANETKDGRVYAVRRDSGRRPVRIYMHREVMSAGKNEIVDHVSGDTLDNRKENLRKSVKAENNKNQKKRVTNRSGFKGVSWCSSMKRWRVRIMSEGGEHDLGYFEEAEAAARAYDEAARKYHGEFARTNEDLGLLKPRGKVAEGQRDKGG